MQRDETDSRERAGFFLSAWVSANLSTMQHEVHDEVSLEMGRRVAARLPRARPPLINL